MLGTSNEIIHGEEDIINHVVWPTDSINRQQSEEIGSLGSPVQPIGLNRNLLDEPSETDSTNGCKRELPHLSRRGQVMKRAY